MTKDLKASPIIQGDIQGEISVGNYNVQLTNREGIIINAPDVKRNIGSADDLAFLVLREGEKLSDEQVQLIAGMLSNKASTGFRVTVEGEELTLTPQVLATTVSPFLNAVRDIQHIIDEVLQQPPGEVKIRSITQFSPISVSLDGAAEAIQIIKDMIVPWRRNHGEVMARLLEQDKLAEIESKKAEILERRANAAKNRAEADKFAAEAAATREQAAKMKLENEKLQIELHRAKIQLVLDVLNQLSSNLSETERISYLVKLLPPVEKVISGNMEIMADNA